MKNALVSLVQQLLYTEAGVAPGRQGAESEPKLTSRNLADASHRRFHAGAPSQRWVLVTLVAVIFGIFSRLAG